MMNAAELLKGHQPLYDNLNDLSKDLEGIETDVKERERQFFSRITELEKVVLKTKEIKNQQSDMHELLTECLEKVGCAVSVWVKEVNSYELNTSFRKDFGDSLLVYVYGKVKAGKSSLGNYVACGKESPTLEWRNELKNQGYNPEFFVSEKNDNFGEDTSHVNGFLVDSAEATSCIQGFRIPGLTWIDSPGIHSVTKDNHDLAQKYVDSADLVIYPMNSAQPGRRSDFREIKDLIKKKKTLLLLITRCDRTDEDEDDDGEIITTYEMKSSAVRAEQAKYVTDEFTAICEELDISNVDFEVLTVSVRFADFHNNSPSSLSESGLESFFEKLSKTIKSEGVNLKKQVPEKSLQAFYDFIISDEKNSGIGSILKVLDELSAQVADKKKELSRVSRLAEDYISSDIAFKADSLVEDFVNHGDVKRLEQALSDEITRAINGKLIPEMNAVTSSMLDGMDKLVSGFALDKGFELQSHYSDQTVSTGGGKNSAIGSTAGSIVGGVIGSFFPVVGTAIGAGIGGFLGGLLGSSVKNEKTVRVKLGDNRSDLKLELVKVAEKAVSQQAYSMYEKADVDLFLPIENAVAEIKGKVVDVQCYINSQRVG